MKQLLTGIAFLLICTFTNAQNLTPDQSHTRLNSIQFEIGGQAGYYSLNYERVLTNAPKFKLAGQVGFAYYPRWTGIAEYWIPVSFNGIFPLKNGYSFETGLGYSFTHEKLWEIPGYVPEANWGGFITSQVGFRYQKPNTHLLIRAGGILFLSHSHKNSFVVDGGWEVHMLPGVALGYSF